MLKMMKLKEERANEERRHFSYKVQKAVSDFASVRILSSEVFLEVLEKGRSKLKDLLNVSKYCGDTFVREHLSPSSRLLYVTLKKQKQ